MKIKPRVSYKLNKDSINTSITALLDTDNIELLRDCDPTFKSVKAYFLANAMLTYFDYYGLTDKILFNPVPIHWFNSDQMDFFIDILEFAEVNIESPIYVISDLVSKLQYISINYVLNKNITPEGMKSFLKYKHHIGKYDYKLIGNPLIDTVADFFLSYNFKGYAKYMAKIILAQDEYNKDCYTLLTLDNASYYQEYGRIRSGLDENLETKLEDNSIEQVSLVAFGFPRYYSDFPYYNDKLAFHTLEFDNIRLRGYVSTNNDYTVEDIKYMKPARLIARIITSIGEHLND